MRNRKFLAGLVLLAFLVAGMTMGTFSKYTKEVVTGNNNLRAAKFVITGNNLADQAQDVTLGKIAPGDKGIFEFTVKNNDGTNTTEVPMQYTVSLERNNAIGNLVFTLYKATEATESHSNIWTYVPVTGFPTADQIATFKANVNEMDRYKLEWEWVENNATDINYQGLTETFRIHVRADQIVENVFFVRSSGKTGRYLSDGTTTERIDGTNQRMRKFTDKYVIYDFNAAGDDFIIYTGGSKLIEIRNLGANNDDFTAPVLFSRACTSTFDITSHPDYIQLTGNGSPRTDINIYLAH